MCNHNAFLNPVSDPNRLPGLLSGAFSWLRLLVGVLVAQVASVSAVDRINAYGPFGSGGTTVRQYDNPGVILTNLSGSDVSIQFCNASGALSLPYTTTELSPALTGTGYISSASLSITTSNGLPRTLPNGVSMWVDIGRIDLKCPDSAGLGLHTATLTCHFKVDGGLVETRQVSREFAILAGGSSDPLYGIGAGVVPAGMMKYHSATTNGTEVSFGEMFLTPPGGPGNVTVSGLVGNYTGYLEIGGAILDTETRTGAEPDSVGPVWSWSIADGTVYQDGLTNLTIRVNGVILWSQTLPAAPPPGFEIHLLFDPANPEYLQPVVSPDGTPVPLPGDDVSNENEQAPDPPPPVSGDPQNETADHDLSVADHYRATRKAIEDSFSRPAGPRFSPDEWAGDVANEMIDSPRGEGGGELYGGLGASLGDAMDIPTIVGPGLSGGDALTVRIFGHTVLIPVSPTAPVMRALLLFFLTIMFFVNVLKIVRGAFASST